MVPASLSLSSDPRSWPHNITTLTQHARLAQLYLSHILATLSVHPAVPPRLRASAAAPPPDLEVPKSLRPLHEAVRAWLYAWAMYVEAHRRTPEEVAADNWHWGTQFSVWPKPPLTGYRAAQLPYKIIPTRPGIVRVSWFFEVKEAFGPEARRHPEMYVHLPLEPDGSLHIGDVRRQWGMENMYFVEWNPQRFCLWPSMDGETLSAVAVRHLLSTNEQYPFLRVIEKPSRQREEVRAVRAHLLSPRTAPMHMRLRLRARHAVFRSVKAYHAFRRPIIDCDAIPILFPDERRRLADALVFLVLAGTVLALCWCAAALVPAVRELLVYVASSRAAEAVVAWGRSEPEVVRAVGWAWAALCALPAFVFWLMTLPLWGPVWLAKTAVLGAWGAGAAVFRAGLEAERSVGVGRAASAVWQW